MSLAFKLFTATIIVLCVGAIAAEVRRELGDAARWTADLDADDVARRAAALDRYSLGPHDWPQPVPCAALSRRLRDTAVRESVLPAMARVVNAGECIDMVAAALAQGADPATRALAARALGSAPRAALTVVEGPLIAATQQDDSSAVAAVVALGQLGDTAAAVRRALVSAFQNGAETIRIEALESIGRTFDAEDIRPFIESGMFDDRPSVRAASVLALSSAPGHFQTSERIALRLRSLAVDSSFEVRDAVRAVARSRRNGRNPPIGITADGPSLSRP